MNKTKEHYYSEFSDFYQNRVAPILPEYEAKRKQDVPLYVAFFSVIVFFCATFLSLAIPVVSDKLSPYFIAGLLVSIGTLMFFTKGKSTVVLNDDYEEKLKTKLMPDFLEVFGSFKWTKFDLKTNYWNYFKCLHKDKVFPLNYFLTIDDTICGEYNDVPINIYEVKASINPVIFLFLLFFVVIFGFFIVVAFSIFGLLLYQLIALLKWFSLVLIIPVVVFVLWKILQKIIVYDRFQGVVVEFKMNKHFNGKTLLYEKKSTNRAVKCLKKDGYFNILLEDVEFNNRFETYSTDQIESRYLLTTAFMERLKNIELAFKAKFVRVSFRDDKLFLVIGVDKDLFAMGNLNKKSDSSTFRELFEEMYSILELVEELKLNQNIGL